MGFVEDLISDMHGWREMFVAGGSVVLDGLFGLVGYGVNTVIDVIPYMRELLDILSFMLSIGIGWVFYLVSLGVSLLFEFGSLLSFFVANLWLLLMLFEFFVFVRGIVEPNFMRKLVIPLEYNYLLGVFIFTAIYTLLSLSFNILSVFISVLNAVLPEIPIGKSSGKAGVKSMPK